MNSLLRKLVAATGLSILALIGGAVWFYLDQQHNVRRDIENGLQAIAQLKVSQITHWRSDQLRNAALVMESPFLTDVVAQWLTEPHVELTEKLVARLRSMQEHFRYDDAAVLDPEGRVRLSLSNRFESLAGDAADSLIVAFQQRRPVLSDLHLGPVYHPPHLDLVAPLISGDRNSGKPVGAILFQIDAREFLFPLIQSWPTPSQTAETLLVRRDGDSVLFLNELRHLRDTGLKLRMPLTKGDLPAAMAVQGKEGVTRGTDYRGTNVLAVLTHIPNSSWFMVAKMDVQEAFAHWKRRSFLIVAFFLAVVVSLMTAGGMAWQYNAKSVYRTLYEAERALRRSEESHRITLMSVGDGIIVTDPEGHVEMLNPAAELLTGWSLEEAHGRALEEVFRIVNEETRRPVENPVARVCREGVVVGLANHTMLIARNGKESPVADSCAPIRDENGAITGTVLVFRDQTDERAAQKRLKAEKERAQQYLDVAGVMMCALDTRANVIMVNKKGGNILGYTERDIVGKNWFEHFIPASIRDHVRGAFSRIITGDLEQDQYVENTVLTSKGEERLIAWHNSILRDGDGSIIGTLSSGEDITGRKRAEEALREAKDNLEVRVSERTAELERATESVRAERQRLYDVLETLPVYVCLLDSDYRMPFANRYFRKTFGDSQGRRCYDFLFHRTEPCETCETYVVMKTRAAHHWFWTGPNGRDYDIYDFPFIDADGAFLILEMGIDITERNLAEDALKQTLADLTRSNEDLEHFAYVASHDLQEPLRNVASALQLLEKRHKGTLGEDSDQLIYYAVDSSKKMKALISDLLTYSRLTARGKPFETVDIGEIITESIFNLQTVVQQKGTQITYDDMPIVRGDATQLLQVFQNLLGNAVKFGPAESPKVHVSAEKKGNEWIFSVKDNGIGIEPHHFDRIFVIFQQLTKRQALEGTGMGLAIVKKIIERHRGRVWVESEVGRGSTFFFTIPVGAAK